MARKSRPAATRPEIATPTASQSDRKRRFGPTALSTIQIARFIPRTNKKRRVKPSNNK